MSSNYSSRINIGLPIKAPIADPGLFPAMQNLHNAVHTLNASFDQVVDLITPPKDATANATSFSFRMSTFWGKIAPGVIIEKDKPATLQHDGFHMGAFGVTLGAGNPTMTIPYGWVLDINLDNSTVQLGWPPAMVNVTGVHVGDILYARENTGVFLIKNMADGGPGGSDGVDGDKFHPIGYAPLDGQLILMTNLVKHLLFKV